MSRVRRRIKDELTADVDHLAEHHPTSSTGYGRTNSVSKPASLNQQLGALEEAAGAKEGKRRHLTSQADDF